MPAFEETLTESIQNLRRGPPLPEPRQQMSTPQPQGQASTAPQPEGRSSSQPEDIRETQGFKDTRRVAVDEFTLGLLPFLEAAVARYLQGDERAFDDIRREAQSRVQQAEQRLGPDESSSIRTKSAIGSVGLGTAAGRALAPSRPITGAALVTGGQGFARGASESIDEPTLSAERLTSGVEQGLIEGTAGMLAGGALRAAERGVGAAAGMAGRRRQSSRRQSNAELRKRGQEVTARPGGQAARATLDEQPEGFFAEISQGVAANQPIEEIARKLRVSQEDVARALLRNRDRFRRIEPGVAGVDIAGQQRTLDLRNVDRLTREAREIVDIADRFRALPASRQRGSRRPQSGTQGSARRQRVTTADPAEQGRREAIAGRSQGAQAAEAEPAQLARQSGQSLRGPALDNAVRARLAVQAVGRRPAGSKLENLDLARENLSDDNLPQVAEALGIPLDSDRLRDRILTALEGLRRPGVSALTGTALGAGAAASDDGDDG